MAACAPVCSTGAGEGATCRTSGYSGRWPSRAWRPRRRRSAGGTAAFSSPARACLGDGDVEGAERRMREAFAWAGGHGAEQELAAELIFDGAMAEFARLRLKGNPVLAGVLNRGEPMRG